MRRETYPVVSRVNELLEVKQNKKLATRYDDTMLYIATTVEFLVDRCFRKLRIEVLQKEESNSNSEGKLHIRKIVKSVTFFQLTPFPIDIILQNSLEKQCKNGHMGNWKADLETKEKLQKEREKLRCKVAQHDKYLASYIEDQVELLTAYVRDETMEFARSKTKQKTIGTNKITKYEGHCKGNSFLKSRRNFQKKQ